MEANDLTLKVNDAGYVNIRANLVLIHPTKGILFHTLPRWNGELTLFGGRVKFGEALEDSCHRELEEELGLTLRVEDLWWDETIFVHTMASKYEGSIFHEFSGFGVYSLPSDYDVEAVEIDGQDHLCQWVSISDLKTDKYSFFPEKLPQMLLNRLK